MFNPNWVRWIRASVNKHFKDNKGTLHLFAEGQNRRTSEHVEFIELRLDGPRMRFGAKDQYRLTFEINTFIQCNMMNDFFDTDRIMGILLQKMYVPSIPVLKLGTGPDDDSSQIGCLTLEDGRFGEIESHNYGQIEPRERIKQSSVEAQYSIELEGE